MTQSQSQVKRFVAANMRRALDLVREELGPDAVILSSQKVPEGVEVITAVEPELLTRGADTRRSFGQKFDAELDRVMDSDAAWRSQAGIENAAAGYQSQAEMNTEASFSTRLPSANLAQEIERAREKMLEAKRKASGPANVPASAPKSEAQPKPMNYGFSAAEAGSKSSIETYEDKARRLHRDQEEGRRQEQNQYQSSSDQQGANAFSTSNNRVSEVDERKIEDLQSELAEMRMLLEQQLWKMGESRSSVDDFTMQQQMKMPNHFSVVAGHLSKMGLSEDISQRLIALAGQQKRASDSWKKCMSLLSKEISIDHNQLLDQGGVFAFVGQTGVGKTTSIAKLAAQYVLKHGPGKVALITTDTYRVGAYDQLRSIGRILNVPVRAVDAENSLLNILASLRNYPLVLVDTAGFRHGDPLLRAQLAQIDACRSMKKILVLSSTSQLPTMKASIHAYSSNKNIDATIVTKLDETASAGEVISALVEARLPVAFTTDGQEIPKDIAPASGAALVAKAINIMKQNQTSAGQFAGGV